MLDKNGGQIHIGDVVRLINGKRSPVTGLSVNEVYCTQKFKWAHVENVTKVVPETREEVVADLAAEFLAISAGDMFDDADELAEQFISRIEALGRD